MRCCCCCNYYYYYYYYYYYLGFWFLQPTFIARQDGVHAERNIVFPILSVCLSANAGTVSEGMGISSHFLTL